MQVYETVKNHSLYNDKIPLKDNFVGRTHHILYSKLGSISLVFVKICDKWYWEAYSENKLFDGVMRFKTFAQAKEYAILMLKH